MKKSILIRPYNSINSFVEMCEFYEDGEKRDISSDSIDKLFDYLLATDNVDSKVIGSCAKAYKELNGVDINDRTQEPGMIIMYLDDRKKKAATHILCKFKEGTHELQDENGNISTGFLCDAEDIINGVKSDVDKSIISETYDVFNKSYSISYNNDILSISEIRNNIAKTQEEIDTDMYINMVRESIFDKSEFEYEDYEIDILNFEERDDELTTMDGRLYEYVKNDFINGHLLYLSTLMKVYDNNPPKYFPLRMEEFDEFSTFTMIRKVNLSDLNDGYNKIVIGYTFYKNGNPTFCISQIYKY